MACGSSLRAVCSRRSLPANTGKPCVIVSSPCRSQSSAPCGSTGAGSSPGSPSLARHLDCGATGSLSANSACKILSSPPLSFPKPRSTVSLRAALPAALLLSVCDCHGRCADGPELRLPSPTIARMQQCLGKTEQLRMAKSSCFRFVRPCSRCNMVFATCKDMGNHRPQGGMPCGQDKQRPQHLQQTTLPPTDTRSCVSLHGQVHCTQARAPHRWRPRGPPLLHRGCLSRRNQDRQDRYTRVPSCACTSVHDPGSAQGAREVVARGAAPHLCRGTSPALMHAAAAKPRPRSRRGFAAAACISAVHANASALRNTAKCNHDFRR
jgi:hypothetical protein